MFSLRRYFFNQVTHETTWHRPGPVTVQLQAQPSSQQLSSLPPGWIQKYDTKSQRPYYFNSFTNESSWQPPASAAVVEPSLSSLPDGWTQATDPSGNVYFVNDRLRLVQVVAIYGSSHRQLCLTHDSQNERPCPPGQPLHTSAVQPPIAAVSSRRLSVAEQQEMARGAFRIFDKDRCNPLRRASFTNPKCRQFCLVGPRPTFKW